MPATALIAATTRRTTFGPLEREVAKLEHPPSCGTTSAPSQGRRCDVAAGLLDRQDGERRGVRLGHGRRRRDHGHGQRAGHRRRARGRVDQMVQPADRARSAGGRGRTWRRPRRAAGARRARRPGARIGHRHPPAAALGRPPTAAMSPPRSTRPPIRWGYAARIACDRVRRRVALADAAEIDRGAFGRAARGRVRGRARPARRLASPSAAHGRLARGRRAARTSGRSRRPSRRRQHGGVVQAAGLLAGAQGARQRVEQQGVDVDPAAGSGVDAREVAARVEARQHALAAGDVGERRVDAPPPRRPGRRRRWRRPGSSCPWHGSRGRRGGASGAPRGGVWPAGAWLQRAGPL